MPRLVGARFLVRQDVTPKAKPKPLLHGCVAGLNPASRPQQKIPNPVFDPGKNTTTGILKKGITDPAIINSGYDCISFNSQGKAMRISSEREQVKIKEAGRMLGCCERTVRRMIERGFLTSHRMPGAGLSAPHYIPADQVRHIADGRRSFQRIDQAAEAGAGISWRTGDWFERDAILQQKAGRLATILGPDPVLAVLAKVGVPRIDACNPEQQRTLNGHLLRLAGYSGQSRTTAWRRQKAKAEAREVGVEEWMMQ